MITTKKPCYPDDRRMDMTAYMGPRRAGKRFFNSKYGENPKDEKEGYPSFIRDDVFRLYKEAGFCFLMPEADGYFGQNISENGFVPEPDFTKSDLYAYMKLAAKHDLPVYPTVEQMYGPMTHQDGPFGEEEKAVIREFVQTVQQYCPENFGGIMLTDEPSYQSLGRVKKIMEYLYSDEIRSIKPDLKIFASMLPLYGPIGCFHPKYQGDEWAKHYQFDDHRQQAYEYYMEQCIDAVGEFCYDYYPFGRDGWLSPGYYRNLELAAQHGKERGIELGITLQSCRMDTGYNVKTGRGRTVYRVPSYEDFRWQVYGALAFGVKRLGCFTFWQHYNEGTGEIFPTAMVVYDPAEETGYRKTQIYDAVKAVNEEVLAIDHIFLRYKWQGCKVVRTSREMNIRLVEGGYEGGCITDVKATRDLLIGCFTHEEDQTEGYWIVNAQNPYRYEMNDVELCMEGAERLLYYRKGKEYDVPLQEGQFRVRLGVGEGIFVIPYGTEHKSK